MRVYELARELDVNSKEILELLQQQMNIELNNHMASVNDQVAAKIRKLVLSARQPAAAAPAAPPKESQPARPTKAAGKDARAASHPAAGPAGASTKASPTASPAPSDEAIEPEEEILLDPRLAELRTEERIRRQKQLREEAELRRRRERERQNQQRGRFQTEAPRIQEIALAGPVTVGELAQQMGVAATDVIRRLMAMGVMAAINQQIDVQTAARVAAEFGVRVEDRTRAAAAGGSARPAVKALLAGDDPSRAVPRAPVVTVLGHVDHGKTSLLDAIRSTRVAQGEAGGITQHIGASTVEWQGKRIVFLDTPGHEAFTAMRARGAQVTDIAVLVVAADDGVMPQTVEAISHARNAGVPIIVALNKIDKDNANPDRVKQQLAEHDLIPEEWGGDTIVVPVSAIQRKGIDELLEMILLVAELQELKADPKRRAVGTIIEAQLDRGRGPVATVLVQTGTLRRGDAFVAGRTWGRVRAMVDDRGRPLDRAGPSTPVEVLGFEDVPNAGDAFEVVADEKTAREIAQVRQEEQRREDLEARKAVSLADFHQRSRAGADKELRLIIKADVQGSLEAIRAALEKVRTEEAYATIIHMAVGAISASDVMLASASDAVILGFNVRPDANARQEAERAGVEIKTYRVIYDLVDDVRDALKGMLSPKYEEAVLGQAEVRQVFKVPNVGAVAGCYVQEGRIVRGAAARLLRAGVVVYDGRIASLKRFKDDVREVAAGYECGIGLERFNDIKEGDVIEAYEQREVSR
ncbi:MAG: translation initiation factor IF-2 [Firmicutes bacterium]|nr:translation initiation factor IF-2 [Bacillota bacterium]